MVQQRTIPRGIRNNNPLNIKIGNNWLGEVKDPTDPIFEQFVSMRYGLRAAFVILRRYIRHYRRQTIEDIIGSWAPEVENKLEAYIVNVCKYTGFERTKVMDYSNTDDMVKLVRAMAFVECGRHIDEDEVRKAYDIA